MTKVAPKKKARLVTDWHPPQERLTRRQMRDVLIHLAETGNVSHACRLAKASRRAIYKRVRTDEAFRDAFEEAKFTGWCGLEDDTLNLARNGYEEPITSRNRETGETEIIDTKRRHYPALNIFLLKSHNPERYRERFEIEGKNMTSPVTLQVVLDSKAVEEAQGG